MYQFEIGLIHYIKEMHKEREAQAAKKAEAAQNQKEADFVRNEQGNKAQTQEKRSR